MWSSGWQGLGSGTASLLVGSLHPYNSPPRCYTRCYAIPGAIQVLY